MGRVFWIIVAMGSQFLLSQSHASRKENQISSGQSQTRLLELYSTQSCSSCPPAQKWVSKLKMDPGLWKAFVPVVYHVDYWDYLGWKDPYSKKEFTFRQQQVVREGGARGPYTPMFVLGGREWRPESKGDLRGPSKDVGDLRVTSKGEFQFEVEFYAKDLGAREVRLFGALLGQQVTTKVEAGENSGRRLEHDFLVLDLKESRLRRNGNRYSGLIRLKEMFPSIKVKSVGFWITPIGSLTPIQAVGGPLKKGGIL